VSKTIDREVSETLWRSAHTFDDLCALGERFVAGELAFFPGWLAPTLDAESDAIAAHLACLCRSGFLTLASQPGRAAHPAHDGTPCVQRAFVTGFVSRALARRLARRAAECAIEIRVFDAGLSGSEVPVSTRDGVPYAFTGHDATADELDCFEDCVSAEALAALREARYVTAFDLTWGREDVLWRELEHIVAGGDVS
jgi:hypothetical protein